MKSDRKVNLQRLVSERVDFNDEDSLNDFLYYNDGVRRFRWLPYEDLGEIYQNYEVQIDGEEVTFTRIRDNFCSSDAREFTKEEILRIQEAYAWELISNTDCRCYAWIAPIWSILSDDEREVLGYAVCDDSLGDTELKLITDDESEAEAYVYSLGGVFEDENY